MVQEIKLPKDNTRLITISTIVIVITIIGSILGSQKMKQDSIERQNRLDNETEIGLYEKEQEAKRINEVLLRLCLSSADEEKWDWIKLNMTENKNGSYTGPQSKWDIAEGIKERAEDKCFKQYK
jgi:hypothetical protein